MAITVLIGKARHQPCHDLESFFYVLLFICLEFDGPECLRDRDLPYSGRKWDIYTTPLGDWMEGENHEIIGGRKSWHLLYPYAFQEDILSHLPPYFEDLADCLEALRVLVIANMKPQSPPYDAMIAILEEWAAKPLDESVAHNASLDSTQQREANTERGVDETTLLDPQVELNVVNSDQHNKSRKRPREDDSTICHDPSLITPCMLSGATTGQAESANSPPPSSRPSSLSAGSPASGSFDDDADAMHRTKRLKGA